MTNVEQLKQLREETSAPMQECQKALEQSQGNIEKAKELLRKWGQTLAGKKMEREVKDGIVDVYLHPNKKMGVMLELRCESDFVAKNEDFQKFSHELCLQIAATNPLFADVQDIPSEFAEKEKEIYRGQMENSGKNGKIIEQAVEGKWKKKQEEICLLEQPWIKDESKRIKDLLTETIAKLGENIAVRKFSRFSIR
jgi:elongation factor Ts